MSCLLGTAMDPRIPSILQPLLQEYADRVKHEMPRSVNAIYLEGSIALGEFNPRLSDIDFIAVLNSRAAMDDFEKIFRIHRKIERHYPAWKMSGMYLQTQDLGCQDRMKDPFPIYHDGRLNWTDHFELSPVTWWILKNCGIAVFGPPPPSLGIPVDMENLIRLQLRNLNTYWMSWTTRPGRILALTSNWGVQWTILGVLRQFYTLREKKITSKVKAGEYALSWLPERWHSIIREAINLRGASHRTYYQTRITRAWEAFHFLRYLIETCNKQFISI